MPQFLNVWTALDMRKRLVVIVATIAVFAAVMAMSRAAFSPSMSLLYAGLENGAAGEVVRSLEQRGVQYEIRGGSILVDSTRRDELRMTLASEGLPANGSRGYELLDNLSGFGTTSQMFDAAYWRAKEGELARTIVTSPHILAARVHIANSGGNPFSRNQKLSASVSVSTNAGSLTGPHAKALKFLVASAVTGLSPEDVAIIDGAGGLISSSEETAPANGSEDRADLMREKVQRLLEARVGYGNAVVEVSVATNLESESIRERRFDPEGRVAISVDTEERSNNATDAAGGDVTVASNLPDGDAAGGEGSSSQNSQTRERINYEVSETEREIVKAPGAIKRLTVAVLVNGTEQAGAGGVTTLQPRSDQELADLKELVASAVGFNEARGDVITLRSMAFEPIAAAGTPDPAGLLERMNLDIMSMIQMAVLAVVALILGLFVLRPILSNKPSAPLEIAAAPATTDLPARNAAQEMALTGEIADDDADFPNLPVVSESRDQASVTDGQDLTSLSTEDPVERLRNMISDRQEETVEILRSWLEDREESV